jgi:argininosuccinate lyase
MSLWNGRFAEKADELARRFGDSIGFDCRLASADIQGSIAYARALAQANLLTAWEHDQIVRGLEEVRAEFASGTFQIKPGDEDIHTAIERRLTELIGPVAGKLGTGRSRNEQVACDLRLYLLEETTSLRACLIELLEAIVDKAETHLDVIMPGYTHLRQAQPLLFSHWLMSFFWKFWRDLGRLSDAERLIRVCPLGAGALAGNPFQIDREALAASLGFTPAQNSVDAVSDRDFALWFLFWTALVQVHLSQLAEDLILWSTQEFGFLELDEQYCTGSSLMPQKKNPDVLELVRGKTGRIIGHLVGLLMVLKGLPSGYNKDLQEDKEAVFACVDTLALELPLAAKIIRTMKVNEDRMFAGLDDGMLATDLADYLVRKGLPFREAHHLVGQAVRRAEELGVSLRNLPYHEYQSLHSDFAEDLYLVFDFHRSVEARDVKGGTAKRAVRAQIEQAKALIAKGKEEENGQLP